MYCEINIDDCAPDAEGNVPCKNDGKCYDGVNSFTCDCNDTGYTGPDCLFDIDECSLPITDCGQGRCKNLPGTYQCICDPGYCGYNCGMIDPCKPVSFFSIKSFLFDIVSHILYDLSY